MSTPQRTYSELREQILEAAEEYKQRYPGVAARLRAVAGPSQAEPPVSSRSHFSEEIYTAIDRQDFEEAVRLRDLQIRAVDTESDSPFGTIQGST